MVSDFLFGSSVNKSVDSRTSNRKDVSQQKELLSIILTIIRDYFVIVL